MRHVVKAGRLANGYERGRGTVVHAQDGKRDWGPSLCGAYPRIQWAEVEQAVTCPECLKVINRPSGQNQGDTMKTIGEIVRSAREASGQSPEKFAKKLKLSTSALTQVERNRPTVITNETKDKLDKAGVKIPLAQMERHNYIARECSKAKNWSKKFVAKLAGKIPTLPVQSPAETFVPLTPSPELQAAIAAVDEEIETKGTVGGVPMDFSQTVQPKPAKTAKATKNPTAIKLPPKAKQPSPATSQGILPGFLDQLDHVRIEEMLVERIFQRLQSAIDAKIDLILGGRKQG